jgi:membrane fusion protein, multidrug efflux system
MSQPKLILLPKLLILCGLCLSCGPDSESQRAATAVGVQGETQAPTVDVVKVVSQKLDITVRLPGELQPYEVVAIYPKVTGFVKWIGVDRGSHVSDGELIARLEAPELVSQRAEAQAKLQSAEAQRIGAEAKLAADESTYQRLKAAAVTPGVVSGNELEVAQKTAEAGRARVGALGESVEAAKAALRSVEEIERYLRLTAPFPGVVTERNVHPGALVGPSMTVPMLRIETRVRLRLVVPVPETFVAGIPEGTKVSFTVPAFPGEVFSGRVARIAHSVDVKTRTMPVELDVMNPSGRLEPGMFPEVLWPVRRPRATLFVPASAVARTTEQTFVVRLREGEVEWVPVKIGPASGKLVEVFGDLHEEDQVALRATDELRPGTRVTPRLNSSN